MRRRLTAGLICSFGVLGEGALRAQEEPELPSPTSMAQGSGSVLSYPPEFFAEYQPNMALDMITRIPGFIYDKGDTSIRGLAGTGGNILIDGQRPSTKSQVLDDILRRIPASGILRIDIIRGGAPGIDMRGQTVVANIVRRSGAATSIATELMTKVYTNDMPARIARIEGSRTGRTLSLEGVLHWREDKDQTITGTGRSSRRDRNGLITDLGKFEADWDRFIVGGNGAAEYRNGPDFVRLSITGERDRQDRRDITRMTNISGAPFRETVDANFASDEGVASIEYERIVSSRLTLRLLALEGRERDRLRSASTGTGVPQTSDERANSGESIVRASGSFVPTPTLSIDGRVERTFNFLDAKSSLVRGGVPVILPSANIRVEERRIDAESAARWQASNGTTVEAALGYESSTIGVVGDVTQSRSLRFLKPRLNVTIEPAKDWEIRLRAERQVSQLDFEDFASTASLDSGTVSAGNPDLTPEQAWLFETVVERRFWGRGAVTLTASHAKLTDVIDLIPIENRFDAPGNIGNGTRQEAKLAVSLPLDRLGASGTLIRMNAAWRRSRVTDPVTAERRRISLQRPFQADITIIKDLPRLRSVITADFYTGFRETSYRINEIRTIHASSDPLAKIYWDWTVKPGTALRFMFENISFRSRGRKRLLYDGPRSSGQLVAIERRNAAMDPFFLVRLRQAL